MKRIETAAPKLTKLRRAAILMEAPRVPEFNTIKCPLGDRQLMESAQDLSRIEIMIRYNGSAEAVGRRKSRICQWGHEDPRLSFPVKGLSERNVRMDTDRHKSQ